MSKLAPKQYKPHRRNSFEPENSVDLGDFLHKGFKPYLWSGSARREGSGNVSLRQASEHRKVFMPKSIDDVVKFNQ